MVVPVVWNAEPGGLTWPEVEAGLAWSLSNLGALPPPEGWLTVVESTESRVVFELDLSASGFDEAASPAIQSAIVPVWESDEMQQNGAVDAGRFLMRTLYSPWRYYSITGACATFDEWSTEHLSSITRKYGVTVSLLTKDDRLITLNERPWEDIGAVGFVAHSGVGVLSDVSVSQESEVIDLMENGQQRYAVFDGDGQLSPAADPTVIGAGQPGKCMWCHEGSLMNGTPANPTTRPYLSYTDWNARIGEMQAMLDTHRTQLSTAVDFSAQTHSYGELIVREFLHPTPARVAAAWGLSAAEMDDMIEEYDLELSLDGEYPSRGSILSRAALDAVMADQVPGFVPLTVLSDDREAPTEVLEDIDAGLLRCQSP